ncbi:MAG: YqgE/AlgH family protein [Myxococcota bacterium]
MRTVVLLVEHGPDRSLGFVVNRPAQIEFSRVVRELNPDAADTAPEVPVMVGGPVSPETGWIVYGAPQGRYAPEDEVTIQVADSIRVSPSRDRLARLSEQPAAPAHMLVLGYAGWGGGQLDAEIQAGSWIPVELDESVVFETPSDDRWNTALAKAGINPMLIVSTGDGGLS